MNINIEATNLADAYEQIETLKNLVREAFEAGAYSVSIKSNINARGSTRIPTRIKYERNLI